MARWRMKALIGFAAAVALLLHVPAFAGAGNLHKVTRPGQTSYVHIAKTKNSRSNIMCCARPYYADGEPLNVGEIVGYELNLPGGFQHAGIHLGPGTPQL